MKTLRLLTGIAIMTAGILITSFFSADAPSHSPANLPYKSAGLTERQAAAHLLSRFTFGATPGQIDEVVAMGLEKWMEEQLNSLLPDDSLEGLLRDYDALNLTNEQVVNTFPRPAQVLKMAVKEGAVNKDSVNRGDRQQYREKLEVYSREKGFRPQRELYRQFFDQKVLRAACSRNQLQEVMTDFWLNHFNVSMTKNQCAEFIPAYERDIIRPNVLGKFDHLLLATSQSPAMLLFLDNFSSSGAEANTPPKALQRNTPAGRRATAGKGSNNSKNPAKKIPVRKAGGLNENYAREVMELHTLGVDGGYTQKDVTEAARVLTGWTLFPLSDYGYGGSMRKLIERTGEDKLVERGFVHIGDFLFAANRHDGKEKIVLGKKFPAGGGYEEGVKLLEMLAHHPSTAAFISRKLAVRFVSDAPPQSLIDKMAKTFLKKDGDIRELLRVMVGSPEFWSKEALREKIKSPFELAISALRSLNAEITQPYQVYNWVNKMGQRLYYYQAPTGFPDKGTYWINTGSLLNRMNFGLALTAQRIPGVKINLLALNNNHEPESPEAALETYCRLLMPERDLKATIQRLTPLLNDPQLKNKVERAAGQSAAPSRQVALLKADSSLLEHDLADAGMEDAKNNPEKKRQSNGVMTNGEMATMEMEGATDIPEKRRQNNGVMNNGEMSVERMAPSGGKNRIYNGRGKNKESGRPASPLLAQVAGIIIGSPEFQRR